MATENNVALPPDLDVGATYTVRVTALDSSGSVVSGVVVDAVTITTDMLSVDTSGDLSQATGGEWFLVPGPLA